MAASQALPDYLTLTTQTAVFHGQTQTFVQTVVVQSALPTQQLPDYLSASTFLTTVNGQEETATSIVELPLTYIGPSIPLGTNGIWTYLGSTTPASLLSSTQSPSSTATPSSSSTSPSSSLTASASSGTTSSLSSSSSQSASSSPSSSNSPSTTTSSPTSTTSSPATSSAAVGAAGSHLSTGQIIGIVIASVIALVVLILLLVLLFYRYRKRRYGSYHHPNNSDFVIVDSEGLARVAGQGSPRPTGEEEDSFLRGSGETVESADETLEVGPGPGITARLVGARPPRSPTGSEHSTGTKVMPEGMSPVAYVTPTNSPSQQQGPKQQSPFFHASASSLFFNPSRGPDRSLTNATAERAKRESGSSPVSSASASPVVATNGKIITTRQLLEMNDQWQQEADESAAAGGFGGLRPGPTEHGERQRTNTGSPLRPLPSYDTSSSLNASYINSLRSDGGSPNDPIGSEDERTMLLTARRFNMSEAGPSTFAQAMETNATSSPSSWHSSLGGLGLGGLARLSRLSWFQRMDAHRSHSPNSGMPTTRSSTPPMTQLRPQSNRASLIMPSRPISHVTSSSTGDTVFYEAPSGPSSLTTRESHNNLGATPRPASMPPLPPRAVMLGNGLAAAPSSAPQTPRPDNDMGSDRESIFSHPAIRLLDPAFSPPSRPRPSPPNATPQQQLQQQTPTDTKPPKNEPFDILDTPVPARAAASPFSSTSTRGGPDFPPGLEHLSNVRSWRESSSDMPSSATFGSRSTASNNHVNIDVVGSGARDSLEDEPPLATANWTQLRAVTVANAIESNRNRRLAHMFNPEETPADDIQSNAGSLHSIPDRLSPLSPLGSGSNSRAPSRQNNSSSLGSKSSSSRSPLSHNGTYTSLGSTHSLLNHSNSITEHGRRRPRREPGEPVTHAQGAGDRDTRGLSPSPAGNDSQHFIRARLSAIGGYKSPPRTPASDAAFVHGATAGLPEGAGAIVGRT